MKLKHSITIFTFTQEYQCMSLTTKLASILCEPELLAKSWATICLNSITWQYNNGITLLIKCTGICAFNKHYWRPECSDSGQWVNVQGWSWGINPLTRIKTSHDYQTQVLARLTRNTTHKFLTQHSIESYDLQGVHLLWVVGVERTRGRGFHLQTYLLTHACVCMLCVFLCTGSWMHTVKYLLVALQEWLQAAVTPSQRT
jgi:hypothetical protein